MEPLNVHNRTLTCLTNLLLKNQNILSMQSTHAIIPFSLLKHLMLGLMGIQMW